MIISTSDSIKTCRHISEEEEEESDSQIPPKLSEVIEIVQ